MKKESFEVRCIEFYNAIKKCFWIILIGIFITLLITLIPTCSMQSAKDIEQDMELPEERDPKDLKLRFYEELEFVLKSYPEEIYRTPGITLQEQIRHIIDPLTRLIHVSIALKWDDITKKEKRELGWEFNKYYIPTLKNSDYNSRWSEYIIVPNGSPNKKLKQLEIVREAFQKRWILQKFLLQLFNVGKSPVKRPYDSLEKLELSLQELDMQIEALINHSES